MPPMPRIANKEDAEVIKLCKRLSPDFEPILLKIETVGGAIENECFQNVAKAIALHGGTVQYGWRIWEGLPGLMIEAEFHAVWIDEEGITHEVSTQALPDEDHILFLPDNSTKYDGKQIDNVRVPLVEDPLVKDFISSAEAFYQAMNEDALAEYHGEVVMTPEMKVLVYRQQDLMLKIISKFYC